MRVRYADYFRCRFIEEQAPRLNAAGEAEAYVAITRDHDNLSLCRHGVLPRERMGRRPPIAAASSWYWLAASANNEGGLSGCAKRFLTSRWSPSAPCAVLAFTSLSAGFRRDSDAPTLAEDAIARARREKDDYTLKDWATWPSAWGSGPHPPVRCGQSAPCSICSSAARRQATTG